ncbi:Phage-related baseplate assembly protein [Novipirellula aureliae]|uniref:Phage-related baseplate assembly protein n=1 Tax=Novipirellula aureliae TaxID=2527966 RepID=A0A5C6E7T4_9BACT|nr:type VI secretion system tip protein VgrG [Novipirellula aureliae]TWU45012.1 Phage-related baseplate assembly protein [Novipirellula aureliae]
MAKLQKNRQLQISTPLGEDQVFLTGFSGSEEMSRLFHYQLDLISENTKIKAEEMVGKAVCWNVLTGDGSKRYWHGYVNQLARGDVDVKGLRNYRIEVVPWLWFLTQTSDCKIFQEMEIPKIIDEVLGDFGFADYKPDFQLQHKEWEYCVQYRETDFNFLSRLMEQEGIYYYFKHSQNSHQMVITDHKHGVYDLPESKVDYPPNISQIAVDDHLDSWERRFEYVPGKYSQRDYNFKTPSNHLETEQQTAINLPNISDYEVYDYPGEYPEKGDGDVETRIRQESEETRHELISSSSTCRSFGTGGKFKVGVHRDSAEEGAEVVITSIHHIAHEAMAYETSSGGAPPFDYQNSFSCIPADKEFRPARTTPKPTISGIQTAIVTGPEGEEIYPDEFGRVKCQFHWDRYGQYDDKSSCWIRVSQGHAGAGFGVNYLPRIDEEVVVSFLEGDPDRPLITGRVYHANNKPHYPLPDHKTRMTIRTNSSKGGEGFNELTFEDLKNEERLYMQAEKNMDTRVKNDSKERIYGNRHQIIGWEKDGEKGGSQKEMVYQDKHLNVKKDQIEKIEGNYEICVGNGDADEGGNHHVVIEKQRTESIGEGNDRTVAKDERIKIGGSLSENIGKDRQTKVGMKQAIEAGQEIHLKAGMKVIIEAGAQLSLVGPGGFVDIGPAGVTIQGMMVKINSGGAAGSGSGCSPEDPEEANEADPSEPAQAWVPDH